MKNIILSCTFVMSFIVSFKSFASCSIDTFLDPKCFTLMIHRESIMNTHCKCHVSISEDLRFSKANPEVESCIGDYIKLYEKQKIKPRVNDAIELIKNGTDKSTKICSNAANEAWKKDYLLKLDSKRSTLENSIKEIFCESKAEPKLRDKVINKCFKSLVKTTRDTKKSIYKECKADPDLEGSRSGAKDCLDIKSYKYILGFENKTFFEQFCSGDEVDREKCDQMHRQKIFKTRLSNDIEYCHKGSKFSDKQLKAKRACEDMLLFNIIGFKTVDELKALSQCIYPLSLEDSDGINQCLNNVDSEDINEKALKEQLMDKYCSEKFYTERVKQLKCFNDLMNANFVDKDFTAQCSSETLDIKDKYQREIAQKHCEKIALYKHLLDKKEFEIDECWNADKYKTFDDKAKCTKDARLLNTEIMKCEQLTDQEAQITCFTSLEPEYDLSRYLKTKAYKLNIDISSCDRSIKLTECILNKLLNNEYGIPLNLTDKNNCKMDMDPKGCTEIQAPFDKNMKSDRGEVVDDNLIANKSSNANDPKNKDGKGNVLGLEKGLNKSGSKTNINGESMLLIAGGSGVLASLGGKSKNKKNNDKNLNKDNKSSKDSGLFGFMNDIKNLKIKSDLQSCKNIKKASVIRLGGLVLGTAAVVLAGVKATKMIKDSKENKNAQKKSFQAMGVLLAGTATGVGIKLMANVMAKNILKENVNTALEDELNHPGLTCSPTKTKKTSIFERETLPLDFQYYTQNVLENLNDESNHKYIMSYVENWMFYGSEKQSVFIFEDNKNKDIDIAFVNMFKDLLNLSLSQFNMTAVADDSEVFNKITSLLPNLIPLAKESFMGRGVDKIGAEVKNDSSEDEFEKLSNEFKTDNAKLETPSIANSISDQHTEKDSIALSSDNLKLMQNKKVLNVVTKELEDNSK